MFLAVLMILTISRKLLNCRDRVILDGDRLPGQVRQFRQPDARRDLAATPGDAGVASQGVPRGCLKLQETARLHEATGLQLFSGNCCTSDDSAREGL
jgi:hypothetical protein